MFDNGSTPSSYHESAPSVNSSPFYDMLAGNYFELPPPPADEKPPDLLAPFGILDFSQLMKMPAKQWLLDQVFGAGDLVLLYGESGSGKTFVAIDMIVACCSGETWAGRFPVQRPLNVLYAAGEGVGGLAQRFRAATQAKGKGELSNFHVAQTVPSVFYERNQAAHVDGIEKFIAGWQQAQQAGSVQPLDLLVIDTLHSASTGADENSAKDAGRILQLAKAATSSLGCTVMLVHHANKNGTGERGSTAFRGAMDCVISISTVGTGDKSVMQCAKLKDGEQWKQQTFGLAPVGDTDSVSVWWDDVVSASEEKTKTSADVDAIIALLKHAPGVRYTANALAEGIGVGGSKRIFDLIRRAMQTDPEIKSGLKHTDRDASSHNPTMYWYGNISQSPISHRSVTGD